MLFTGIPVALLLITFSAIATPISVPSIDTSTELIEAAGTLEENCESAIKIIVDISCAEAAVAAVEASAETMSSIVVNAASAQSSDFTTDSEVEDPNINKRWGKNSFKDCTDKYDCAVECGMGTDQCWKTCKGNPSYPDCDTYNVQKIDNWQKQHNDREKKEQKKQEEKQRKKVEESRKKESTHMVECMGYYGWNC